MKPDHPVKLVPRSCDESPPRLRARKSRRCNLCAGEFEQQSPFERFCATCRDESELLRFSEWLPDLDAALTERLSA